MGQLQLLVARQNETLDQIEARTPIAAAPFAITNPGSYYLTSNLAVTAGDAITISADNVTLDLNGFIISSTEATPTSTGVLLAGGRVALSLGPRPATRVSPLLSTGGRWSYNNAMPHGRRTLGVASPSLRPSAQSIPPSRCS